MNNSHFTIITKSLSTLFVNCEHPAVWREKSISVSALCLVWVTFFTAQLPLDVETKEAGAGVWPALTYGPCHLSRLLLKEWEAISGLALIPVRASHCSAQHLVESAVMGKGTGSQGAETFDSQTPVKLGETAAKVKLEFWYQILFSLLVRALNGFGAISRKAMLKSVHKWHSGETVIDYHFSGIYTNKRAL